MIVGRRTHRLDDALKWIRENTDPPNERGCRLWNGNTRGNPKHLNNYYPVIWLDYKRYSAHRLQWELLRGPIPDGFLVCHHCDEPLCMNIEHHFLGTHKENTKDMIQKGRAKYGEKHPMKKLTDLQVAEVKARFTAGETQTSIAKSLGMGTSQINRIVRGHSRILSSN